MRRAARPFILLATLALLAAACGNGGDNGGQAGGGGPDAEEVLGDVDLAGVEVEIAGVWTGSEQEAFRAVLDAFEEQTGASVTYTSTGDDIAAALGPRISGGSPPDVAMLPQPGLLRDYAEEGVLQPVEEVVGETVDANYDPIWRELGTVDDELYGVWFKAANKSLVWYNVGAFEDAGVQPPETFEDFLSAAQTLTDSGVPALSVGGADGWTLTDWFENVYLRVAGPEQYDQLAEHEIPWTDESVKESLRVLADAFDPDLLAGGTQAALQNDFNTSITRVFTDPPEAAMVYGGDPVAGVITADTNAQLGTDAEVFEFPEIEGSGPAVVGGGDVAVLMRDSEGGRALIEFLATPTAAEAWASQGGFISPNQNVDTEVYPDEISRDIATAVLEAGENFRFDLSDLQPSEFGSTSGRGLFKLFQDFLANPSDVDGIAQQLEDAAAAAYGG
ncbi:MAG: ABC transporter substrate-binding protein [Actinomycetota bacterium]|nr:ABC transporter substrate-binding protein [Actinomycetota bacterium]